MTLYQEGGVWGWEDWHPIIPDKLYLGNRWALEEKDFFTQLNIGHVLSVTIDPPIVKEPGVVQKHIALMDDRSVDLAAFFEEAHAFIEATPEGKVCSHYDPSSYITGSLCTLRCWNQSFFYHRYLVSDEATNEGS
jgi:hypothetical protein